MAKVHIHSGQGAVGTGDLQLQNGAPMDATLRPVTDAANTASPLELSTGLVAVTSTLQIATNDTEYIDAEDGSGNNRFTVSRASGSQVVNVDFASNPTSATDQVGAIRTYEDGANLSDSVSFLRNGNVGIGTNAPDATLNIVGANQCNLRVESTIVGGGIDLKDSTTTADNQVGIGAFGDDLCFRSGGVAAGNMRLLANGNLGVGTTIPNTKMDVISGTLNSPIATFSGQVGRGLKITTFNSGNNDAGVILDAQTALGVLTFATVGSERMRISAAGNVGIGTTNPTAAISGVERVLQISNSNIASLYLTSTSTGTIAAIVDSARNFGIFDVTAGVTRATFTANGLTFNGDTAAANALDDYEEGTWTPVLTGSTGTPTGFVANYISGSYTKIGRQVVARFGVNVNNVGTGGAGTLRVTGLPFSNATYGPYQEPTAPANGGRWVTAANAGNVYAFVVNGSSYMDFRTMALNADTPLLYSELQGGASSVGTWFSMVVTYFVS